MSYKNPVAGHRFEKRVKTILESCGYLSVRDNHWMSNYDFTKDLASQREFDLVMFKPSTLQFYIVECRAHLTQDKHVGVGLVKEFEDKTRYYSHGALKMMVTDTYFSKEALSYAAQCGIEAIDGEGLERLERTGSLLKGAASKALTGTLEGLLSRIFG